MRWWWPALGALICLAPCVNAGRTAEARDERQRPTFEDKNARTMRRQAIDRACRFIAKSQDSFGAWGDNRAQVARTALCTLALMAEGSSSDHRGKYRSNIRGGINYLLKLIEREKPPRYPKGYFFYAHDQDSRMHGQGFATLALACALGTSEGSRAQRIRTALRHAIRCIEGSQANTGGFGYEPRPDHDHEGSVTVCVAQGLRAARDAGLFVDADVVRGGLRYLRKSQRKDGSFNYSLTRQHSTYALTAAALSSFFLYGHYGDRRGKDNIQDGLDYLREQLMDQRADQDWYYYGHFYAAWALWQWDGDTWEAGPRNHWGTWHRIVYPHMIGTRQRRDGSFQPFSGRFDYGPELSTAFAVLTLAIPDEALPIFQR